MYVYLSLIYVSGSYYLIWQVICSMPQLSYQMGFSFNDSFYSHMVFQIIGVFPLEVIWGQSPLKSRLKNFLQILELI